jgi:hypothetical protein
MNNIFLNVVVDPVTMRIVSYTHPSDPNCAAYPDSYKPIYDSNAANMVTSYFSGIKMGVLPEQDLYFKPQTSEVTSLPSVTSAKINKIKELYADCDYGCKSGLVSPVLGTPHFYPSQLLDQQNIQAAVFSSLTPYATTDWRFSVTCAEAENIDSTWALREHNKQQIQQLGDAYVRFIEQKRKTLRTLINIVNTVPDTPTLENYRTVKGIFWHDQTQ